MRELPGAYGVPEVLVSRVGEWEYLATQMNNHRSRAAKPQLGASGLSIGSWWEARCNGRLATEVLQVHCRWAGTMKLSAAAGEARGGGWQALGHGCDTASI